jgi:hypothetical protein
VRWMQGAARALQGIPTSVKDEDAIVGLTPKAGLQVQRNETELRCRLVRNPSNLRITVGKIGRIYPRAPPDQLSDGSCN